MKLQHGPIEPRPLPDRRDPDYDDALPRPLTWTEIRAAWRLAIAAAFAVALALVVGPYVWAFFS